MTYPAKPFYEISQVNPPQIEEEFSSALSAEDIEFINERKRVFDQITTEFTTDMAKVKIRYNYIYRLSVSKRDMIKV